jgi:hypothetical protein
MSRGIHWLQQWYYAQCDGDWEHQNGIKIETLDNPGWAIRIQIGDTSLSSKRFESVNVDRSEHDWIHCKVEAGEFLGYGGPLNLEELVEVFRGWAQDA